MDFQVRQDNNFCRVFKLPKEYPSGYCFAGGNPVEFLLVDWFNPVPDITEDRFIDGAEVDELIEGLQMFIAQKKYWNQKDDFVVICDFGLSFAA
jgi:hypothetical protein